MRYLSKTNLKLELEVSGLYLSLIICKLLTKTSFLPIKTKDIVRLHNITTFF